MVFVRTRWMISECEKLMVDDDCLTKVVLFIPLNIKKEREEF